MHVCACVFRVGYNHTACCGECLCDSVFTGLSVWLIAMLGLCGGRTGSVEPSVCANACMCVCSHAGNPYYLCQCAVSTLSLLLLQLLLACQLTAAIVLAWAQSQGSDGSVSVQPQLAMRFWTIIMGAHMAAALAMQVSTRHAFSISRWQKL